MPNCEALLGWCKNTLGPASVPHVMMATFVGGIVRYAAFYLSDAAAEIVPLNAAIKTAALQFENVPKDLSNIVVRSNKGLRLADVRVLYMPVMASANGRAGGGRATKHGGQGGKTSAGSGGPLYTTSV